MSITTRHAAATSLFGAMTMIANLGASLFAVSNVRVGTCMQVTCMQVLRYTCTQVTCLMKTLLYLPYLSFLHA